MKKLFSRKWFKVLLIIAVVYLISVFGLWIFFNYQNYATERNLSEKYISNHQQELKEEIFNKAFNDSNKCNGLTEKDKLKCQQIIGKNIGTTIQEEELTENTRWWPNDLIFVKQEKDKFYVLHQSGNSYEITSQVNKSLLESTTPLLIKYLSRQCNFFSLINYQASNYYCETYSSFPLLENQTGYLVRITPLTEETEIGLNFIMPVLFPLIFINQIFINRLIP